MKRRYAAASCRQLAGRDLGVPILIGTPELVAAGSSPPNSLTLRELEALACALLPVLLAFLHTGVARQKSILAKSRTKLGIKAADRAGESHANRSRLPAHAATLGRGHNIDLLGEAPELQRLPGVMQPRGIRKILLGGTAIDRKLSPARPGENPRNRFLASSRAVKPGLAARCGRINSTQSSSSNPF